MYVVGAIIISPFFVFKKMTNKNIILTGMRASGKSMIASVLAKKLHREFFDTDEIVQAEQGMSISEIVAKNGWDFFRNEETKTCQKLGGREGAVIATGGGAVMRDENVRALKKNGFLVFLKAPIADLVSRIEECENYHRPSLTGKSITEELQEIWKARKERYFSVADIVLETPDYDIEKIGKEFGEYYAEKLISIIE